MFINKAATVEQIKRDIFDGISIQTVYTRLRKLKVHKHLEVAMMEDKKGFKYVYNLSRNTFNKYIKERLDKVKGIELKSYCLKHDLALSDIRFTLEKKKIVHSYFSENQTIALDISEEDSTFNSLVNCRVDAILGLSIKNKNQVLVGLEYEESMKSKERCLKKVNNYYLRPEIEAVLFIYKNQQIFNRFSKIENNFSPEGRHKLFFASLEDVLDLKDEITFKNIKGAKIHLN